jgi:ribonuclease BN (tRNA processing enzyme)
MARLTFLGTGDPLNEERTQTSLALPIGTDNYLLIDAGSGTSLLRQLQRAAIPLPQIRHLAISHRHFDHVGGVAPLLVALVPHAAAQITIHATAETTRALHTLLTLTIPGVEDWLGARLRWHELLPERPTPVGDARLIPFVVEHGIECIGMRIEQGRKRLVFSADTIPSAGVIKHAGDVDLLIHEAYSLDQEAESAHRFGHSTAGDAGRAGRAARARRLILTHLRASHFTDPGLLAAEAGEHFGRAVEIAGDGQTIDY